MLDHLSTDCGGTIEVGIVEGDPALGENLRHAVDAIPDTRCIGVWNTAESGLRKIDAFRPKIVLMDIDVPGMSGIKATALLKRCLPETQVIIVSAGDDHERVLEAMKAGACGFLLKPAPPAGIRVPRPTKPALSAIARRVTEALHESPPGKAAAKGAALLTTREVQVVRLIAEGLSNKEIAANLNIATHTVHGYIKILFRKLNVRSRTELAVKQLTLRNR